ncbi:unnamed protein product [Pylaiella littoralis]
MAQGGTGGSFNEEQEEDEEDEEEEEGDLEDAWANAGDADSAQKFFQERVLGDRRGRGGEDDDGRDGGLCLDAYVFGGWEQHTKGFGSRMMNRMGYRRGEGLGKEKQGISRPVPIRVLPERRALDHLRVDDGDGTRREGSSTGGSKRKTKKKPKPGGGRGSSNQGQGGGGMFNFLNKTMHTSMNKGKAAAAVAAAAAGGGGGGGDSRGRLLLAGQRVRPTLRAASYSSSFPSGVSASNPPTKSVTAALSETKKGEGGGGRAAAAATASDMSQSELRSHLVGAREAEASLAAKVGRLQETIARNTERDPRTAAQARQKLEEVRLQAKEVRASRDRAERVLGNRGLDGRSGSGKGGKKGRGKGSLFSF